MAAALGTARLMGFPQKTPPELGEDWRSRARGPFYVTFVAVIVLLLIAVFVFHVQQSLWPIQGPRHPQQPVVFSPTFPDPAGKYPLDTWLEALRSDNENNQQHAFAHLAKAKPVDERTVSALTELLADEKRQVFAADTLGEIGYEASQAADALQRAATVPESSPARTAAMAALLRVDPFRVVDLPPEADPILVAALRHPDRRAARFAAYCLAARKSSAAELEILLPGLPADECQFAPALRFALAQMGREPELFDELPPGRLMQRLFKGDKGVADYLIAQGPALAPELIEGLVADPSERLPRFAARVAQGWGAGALPAYEAALDRHDRHLQRALQLLAEIKAEATPLVPKLIELIEHDDFHVSRELHKTLRAIGPGAAAAKPALQRPFKHRSDLEYFVTLYCLDPSPEQLEATWEAIQQEFPSKYDGQDSDGFAALLDLKPAPVPLLLEVLASHKDKYRRKWLVHALVNDKADLEPHLPLLVKLLDMPPYVKEQTFPEDPFDPPELALDLMACMGTTASTAADRIIDLLDSPSRWVRHSAIRALGCIAVPDTADKIVSALARKRNEYKRDGGPFSLDFALKKIHVMLGPEVSKLQAENRALLDGLTPYAIDSAAADFATFRPPVDPVDRPARPKSDAELISDVQKVHWRLRNSSQETPLDAILAQGGDDISVLRPYIPVLLSYLARSTDLFDGFARWTLVRALWRLTKSPLIPGLMAETHAFPPDVLVELGPLAERLGPLLVGRKDALVCSNFRSEDAVVNMLSIPLIGPRAREVVPDLQQIAFGGPGGVSTASITLWRLDHDASLVPELIQYLKPSHELFLVHDSSGGGRRHVAWALGQIGPEAKEAIPMLAAAAYIDGTEFGVAAAWAIRQIDADAARSWGIPAPEDLTGTAAERRRRRP
jgi:HEAT repeat protein